jgi:vancomycin resistance protein YoaR
MAHIDTLATARRLEQSGLPTQHARAVAEAIADAIQESQPDWSEIATKEFVRAEIQALRAELKAEIQALRAELKTEIQAVRAELKTEIQELKTGMQGLRTEMQAMRADFRGEMRSQMIWFFVMLVAVASASFTLAGFLLK